MRTITGVLTIPGKRAASICVVATILAGCGHGSVGVSPSASTAGPDVTAIRGVLTAYAHAVAASNGGAACGLMDDHAALELAQAAAGGPLDSSTPPGPGCIQMITQEAAGLTAQQRAAFNAVTVGAVVIEGSTATVAADQIRAPNTTSTTKNGYIVLVKIAGAWRIDDTETTS